MHDHGSNSGIALKKKHNAADPEARYNGTILGKMIDRAVKVEGGDISSIQEWSEKRAKLNEASPPTLPASAFSSRRPSSALSSLGDQSMESMEF